MQQRLSLSRAAIERTARAILLNLRDVTTHGAPAFYLPFVVRTPAAHEITAIPLKPAARIFVIDQAVLLPYRERLRRIDFEEVQFRIMFVLTKFRITKPGSRKFPATVG